MFSMRDKLMSVLDAEYKDLCHSTNNESDYLNKVSAKEDPKEKRKRSRTMIIDEIVKMFKYNQLFKEFKPDACLLETLKVPARINGIRKTDNILNEFYPDPDDKPILDLGCILNKEQLSKDKIINENWNKSIPF